MPESPLCDVHEAAREGRVSIGGPAFRADLMLYLREYVRMTEFSEAVLLELRDDDFINSPEYEGVKFDAYGVALSKDLQKRFDIEGLETWYVKFTMAKNDDGDEVLMASLHKPKDPLARVGGTLPIRFTRRRSA